MKRGVLVSTNGCSELCAEKETIVSVVLVLRVMRNRHWGCHVHALPTSGDTLPPGTNRCGSRRAAYPRLAKRKQYFAQQVKSGERRLRMPLWETLEVPIPSSRSALGIVRDID